LCAIEVELTDRAREAVIRVGIAVTEFIEDREEICSVLEAFFI
jgi:CRISPR/Cas system-associated exonuclease Cas4 (RecB family)